VTAPKASSSWRGVFPVLSTPFSADDTIDSAALKREIDFVYNHGAQGIVVGMVSEVLKLEDGERRFLAERVVELNEGRGKTVISVGAESTQAAVSFARHAEQIKAAAVMAIPPTTASLSDQQKHKYYATLIEAIDIPVVVQDASGYVGQPMSTAMQASLVNTYGPDRVFLKPEAPPVGPRVSALLGETRGKATIFEGSGGIGLIDNHRRGVRGTMPGADLCWAVASLWRTLEEHDDDRAYAIGGTLALIVSIQTTLDTFIGVEKHLLVKQGVFNTARMREPVSYVLDAETRSEVDRLFQRLRFLTSSDGASALRSSKGLARL
jgi:dihydrodipicolinate synthase/N-acetylneuraminate lyase